MRNAPFTNVQMIGERNGAYDRIRERLAFDEYSSYRPEGDAASQSRVQYGYEKDLIVKTEAKQISLTKFFRKTNKSERDMNDMIRQLSIWIPNAIDLDLAHRITFAGSTSYVDRAGQTIDVTTGDGLAPASASHTLTGSSITYSTVVTGNPPFSKGAYELALKSMVDNSYNNLGQKMALPTRKCVVTTEDPNTCNTVKELLKATADTSSSNSGTYNWAQNAFEHVIVPRIATNADGSIDTTKAKYWAVVCPDASDLTLGIVHDAELSSPMDQNNGVDVATGNYTWEVDAIYGIAQPTAKAWRYSLPTSS